MRKILDSIVMRYIYCRFPTMQSTHNTKKLKQPQSIWSVFFFLEIRFCISNLMDELWIVKDSKLKYLTVLNLWHEKNYSI